MKKISVYWALSVGALFVALQVLMFVVRFGRMNTDSPFLDYVWFFIAGTVGGWILISFLNRQESNGKRWVVLIGFLIGTVGAMFFALGGGLLGPIGLILFPQIPWALFTWLGSLAAKMMK